MQILKKEIIVSLIAIILVLFLTYQVNAERAVKLALAIDDYEIEEVLLSELTDFKEVNIIELEEADEVEKSKELKSDYLITGDLINLGGARFRLELEVKDLEKEALIYEENITGSKNEITAEILTNNIKELETLLLFYGISGQVVDETGEAIEGAEIIFSEAIYDSVFSDSDGLWQKDDLVKQVEVKIEKEGWEFAPQRIEVHRELSEIEFQGRKKPYLNKLEVDLEENKLYKDNEYQLEVVGYDQYGATYNIEPEWEVWGGIGELTYLSSRRNEVIFKADEKGRGTLEIEANGLKKEIDVEILREPAYLNKLVLTAEKKNLEIGDEIRMDVQAFDQYGKEYETDFYWSSKKENIRLDKLAGPKNKVTALEKGSVEIIVSSEDLETKTQLEVLGLDKIEILPEKIELVEGEKYQFEAIGFDQQGNQIAINPQWEIVAGSGEIKSDGSKAIYQADIWGGTKLEVVDDDIFKQAVIEVDKLRSWSFNLGLNYNTYNLDSFNQGVLDRGASSIDSGAGFYLAGKRWLNQIDFIEQQVGELARDIAVGVEIERMSLNYDDIEVGDELTLSNTGLLLTGKYNFIDELSLNLALGQYWAREVHDFSGGKESNNAFNLGFKPGIEFSLPVITNQLNLNGRANYRFGEVGAYDFSGTELSLLAEVVF